MCCNHLITNLLLSLHVKKFSKLTSIWQSNRQQYSGTHFVMHRVYAIVKTYQKTFPEAETVTVGDISMTRRSVHEHRHSDRDHHHKQVLDTTVSFPRPHHAQDHHRYWLRRLSQHLSTNHPRAASSEKIQHYIDSSSCYVTIIQNCQKKLHLCKKFCYNTLQ